MITFPLLFLPHTQTGNDGGHVQGFSAFRNDVLTIRSSSEWLCTVRGDQIYKGRSNYRSDVLYTIRDGAVYSGTSNYRSDIVMTIRDGKIYRGTSTYQSDILATIRDGVVYAGTSNYRSDIRFTTDGHLTLPEFVAVWHAVTYVY